MSEWLIICFNRRDAEAEGRTAEDVATDALKRYLAGASRTGARV